jgi:phage terminase large subunit GpA-like protein
LARRDLAELNGSVRLWKIGVSMIKSELFNFLKQRKNEDGSIPTGYMHFPEYNTEYNTEYFKQLTAEQLVTRIVKGYPKRIWQKTRDRNEALDCRVYARAAAIALGIDRWSESKWEHLVSHTAAEKSIEKSRVSENATLIANASTRTPARRQRIIRSSMMQ